MKILFATSELAPWVKTGGLGDVAAALPAALHRAKHAIRVLLPAYPALLKGFFDRVFLPKFAFEYEKNSPLPKKLLIGRSARAIVTMDTPIWYYWLIYKMPGHNSVRNCILKLCGINPVKFTSFYPVRHADGNKRKKWIETVEKLGQKVI